MAAEALTPADPAEHLAQLIHTLHRLHGQTIREFWGGVPVHICSECSQTWPCRTVEALSEEEEP